MSCHTCKTNTVKLTRCSRCKTTRYCSVDCQSKDWSEHKKVCGKILYNMALEQISKDPLFLSSIKLMARNEIGLVNITNIQNCTYSLSKISSVKASQICDQTAAVEISNFIKLHNGDTILILFTDGKGAVTSITYPR